LLAFSVTTTPKSELTDVCQSYGETKVTSNHVERCFDSSD